MSWTVPAQASPVASAALAQKLQDPRAIALANEGAQVQAACLAIKSMPIVDQNDLDQLAQGMKEAKHRLKELEQGRRALTDPLLADVEVYREWHRPPERAYAALLDAMKARTARHYEETAARQQAAQLAAGQAFQAGEQARAFDALAAAPLPAHADGVGVRYEVAIEVTAPGDVPRELCVPDERMVLARAKMLGDDALKPGAIPGVRVFKKPIVSVRG